MKVILTFLGFNSAFQIMQMIFNLQIDFHSLMNRAGEGKSTLEDRGGGSAFNDLLRPMKGYI